MMRLNPRKGNKNKNQAATNTAAAPAAVSTTTSPATTITAAPSMPHAPVSHAVNIPKVRFRNFVDSEFCTRRHHCVISTSS
jgi:hypothetical protein